MTEDQLKILDLIEKSQWELALASISKLNPDDQKHGRMLVARGDALYELGNDLESMTSYKEYLVIFPGGRGKNFALFGIAMCLKNLSLQGEALKILMLISPDHFGLSNELDHSRLILSKQRAALADVKSFLN